MYSFTEGETYTIKATVTNSSTRNGQPVEATMVVDISLTGVSIPAMSKTQLFPAGGTIDFTATATMPAGSGGKSGQIVAKASDPAGNLIASVQADFQVTAGSILRVSITRPHYVSPYILVYWQVMLFDLHMKLIAAAGVNSSQQTLNKQFEFQSPPQDVLMFIRLVDQTITDFDSPFYRVQFPDFGNYVWDDTAKTLVGPSGPATVTELNYDVRDFLGTILSTRLGNVPSSTLKQTYATILLESIAPDGPGNIFHYMLGDGFEFQVNLPVRLQYDYWGDITEILVPNGTKVTGTLNPPAPPPSGGD